MATTPPPPPPAKDKIKIPKYKDADQDITIRAWLRIYEAVTADNPTDLVENLIFHLNSAALECYADEIEQV